MGGIFDQTTIGRPHRPGDRPALRGKVGQTKKSGRRLYPLTVRALRPGKVAMVKEERGLRTRLAAGSKRRIARRTNDDFCFRLNGARDIIAAAEALSVDRLNTKTKTTAT